MIHICIVVPDPPPCVLGAQFFIIKLNVVEEEMTVEPEQTLILDIPVGANAHREESVGVVKPNMYKK